MKKESLKISSPIEVFNSAISPYISNVRSILDNYPLLLAQFSLIEKDLYTLINYMLNDRFQPKVKMPPKTEKSSDYQLFTKINKGESIYNLNVDNISVLSPIDMIKFFKILELNILKSVKGEINELKLGDFTDICRSLLNNLSTLLLDIKNSDVGRKNEIHSVLFSFVSIYRSFKVKSKPESNTLTDAYNGVPMDTLLKDSFSDEQINKWLDSIDLNLKNVKFEPKILMYSGNASSPNSGASSTKLLEDVAAISKDSKKWESILKIASQFKNGDQFNYLLMNIWNNVQFDTEFMNKDHVHSRLFHFTAPGGKARIIANVDWVSQTALSAIHFHLFSILKEIPADFTFNHKEGIDHLFIENSNNDNDNYYSIDLSAATDRIPRILQSRLLSNLYSRLGYDGELISSCWLEIVDRVYSTKNSPINNGLDIRYTVGQGMGLYTSWPIMSLLHHYITNHLAGVPFSHYSLVGDDNLIKSDRISYEKYLKVMENIGVNINLNKTLESESTCNHSIEFARNYVIDGKKIYPIQWGLYFAYNHSKTNIETILFSMKGFVNNQILDEWIGLNNSEWDKSKYIEILYYLTVNKILPFTDSYNIISKYIDIKRNLTGELLLNIRSAIETAKAIEMPVNTFAHRFNRLTDTYKSLCVVRKKSEVIINSDLSGRLSMLCYTDDQLVEDVMMMTNRLSATSVIVYDLNIENSGSPLISKRERKLLIEVYESVDC